MYLMLCACVCVCVCVGDNITVFSLLENHEPQVHAFQSGSHSRNSVTRETMALDLKLYLALCVCLCVSGTVLCQAHQLWKNNLTGFN